MDVDSTEKGGGDQIAKQAELGSIPVVFSETIQSVDEFKVLNNFSTKDGASANRRYICCAV